MSVASGCAGCSVRKDDSFRFPEICWKVLFFVYILSVNDFLSLSGPLMSLSCLTHINVYCLLIMRVHSSLKLLISQFPHCTFLPSESRTKYAARSLKQNVEFVEAETRRLFNKVKGLQAALKKQHHTLRYVCFTLSIIFYNG